MSSVIDGIDYGPLAQLLGTWIGKRGIDNAPDNQSNPDITEFTDQMTFTVAGAAENAEEQELVAIKYHHVVRKTENDLIFHDQIGHWIYEPSTQMIMHSLTIPRGVCLLAGGEYTEEDGKSVFEVRAESGAEDFGIVQSPFMCNKAKTKAFDMKLVVSADELSYREVTYLHIYGKDFDHIDKSSLRRIAYDTE